MSAFELITYVSAGVFFLIMMAFATIGAIGVVKGVKILRAAKKEFERKNSF